MCLANDCVFCVLLCPFLQGGEPLAAPAGTFAFPAQTTKLQTLEGEDLTWRKMGGTETASVSLFLVEWQRPSSYFQLVSGLPFPMSSKCPILPTGLLSLQEGDVSQKGLYLAWGFLVTPVHLLHLPIQCLCRASSMQTQGTGGKGTEHHWHRPRAGAALDNSTSLWETQGKRDGAAPVTWSQHRLVAFQQLNPNSVFLGIKCLPGKGQCL